MGRHRFANLLRVIALAVILGLNLLPFVAVGQAAPAPRALFDESHVPLTITAYNASISPSLGITTSFSLLAATLRNHGFIVDSASLRPLLSSALDGVSVLVLPPSKVDLSSTEEGVILDFTNRGGGLLLLGEDSYVGHTRLAAWFGITPQNAVVCDPVNSLPVKPFHIQITRLNSHPVTVGVGSYIFDSGQPLEVSGSAVPLAYSGSQSWWETDHDGVRQAAEIGGDIIVLAAAEYGRGRVVVTGDSTGLMNFDAIRWSGLNDFDTKVLSLNMFSWLSGANSSSSFIHVGVPQYVPVTIDAKTFNPGSVDVSLPEGKHEISVPEIVQVNDTTRLEFIGWSGGGPQTPLIDINISPNTQQSYTALYLTQYRLSINSDHDTANGAGWYDEDTFGLFSISDHVTPASGVLGFLGAVWYFRGWYEDGNLMSTSAEGSIVMNRPHRLIAVWQLDYYRLLYLPIVVAFLVGLLGVYLFRRRSQAKGEEINKESPYESYLTKLDEVYSRGAIRDEVYRKLREEYLKRIRETSSN
ncbi:MAG: hypothetical protein ABSG74_09735 [Candidatus Bathyarchaeia archaeon]|jgi:uncharacterized membrane protein